MLVKGPLKRGKRGLKRGRVVVNTRKSFLFNMGYCHPELSIIFQYFQPGFESHMRCIVHPLMFTSRCTLGYLPPYLFFDQTFRFCLGQTSPEI